MKKFVVIALALAVYASATGCASTPQETNSRLDHLSAGVNSLASVVNEFAAASEDARLIEIAAKVDQVGATVSTGISDVKASITAEGTVDPAKLGQAATNIGNMIDPRLGALAGLLGSMGAVFFNQKRKQSDSALRETVRGVESYKQNGSDAEAKEALKKYLGQEQSAATKIQIAKIKGA